MKKMVSKFETVDWDQIEREYRTSTVSVMAIAKQHNISPASLADKIKNHGWERNLIGDVQERVRQKLIQEDSFRSREEIQDSVKRLRYSEDEKTIEAAAILRKDVILHHRKNIQKLNEISSILSSRLIQYINGEQIDGPLLGDRESISDLLEKLSRIHARLIPLERQAYNIDSSPEEEPSAPRPVTTPDRMKAALALLMAKESS